MLALSPATRIFVAVHPVDLRLGFNGLCAWVKNKLAADPLSGHLFVFTNKRRNRLKLLYCDGSGLWVCMKRLEKGTFLWPKEEGVLAAPFRPEQLQALLHGMVVGRMQKWLRI